MTQHLGLVSIVVRDYDEAIDFYVNQLGFRLIEDSPLPGHDKRWVVVARAAPRVTIVVASIEPRTRGRR